MSIDIALQRIVAQRLAGPVPRTVRDAVDHLSAVQAQELKGAYLSLSARLARSVVPDGEAHAPSVRAALGDGSVVRSWPMRGTLHLTTSEDLPWMLGLTAERQHRQAVRRRAELGLDAAIIEEAAAIAAALIADRGPVTRADLAEAWTGIGANDQPGRVYHLIYHLSVSQLLVQGPQHPTRPSEQLFVDGRGWLPAAPQIPREEALARWTAAYFRSHGPATAKDAAAWMGLTLTDIRTGAAAAVSAGEIEVIDVDGVPHFRDPAVPDLLAAHREEAGRVLLLPGFDELMTGYADRSATLPPEHFRKVLPSMNGVFRPTVVAGGRMVGTWARAKDSSVTATPFERFAPDVAAALAEAGVTAAG